jgi:hypothetical protein
MDKTLRRWWLCILVLATLAVCFPGVTQGAEAFKYKIVANEPITCPPGDRTDWTFDPARPRADRITWMQVPPTTFNLMCEPWRSPNVRIAGCAYVYPDPIYGGHYGVIYVVSPPEVFSEGFQEHEECHTQGWSHGKHWF